MTKGKNDCISCRDVLWILVFCGFGVNYVLRINLNLAIVAMVVPREKSAITTECAQNVPFDNHTFTTTTATTTTMKPMTLDSTDRYHWNEYQQGMALGAYYWLHWLMQLPGGLLARRYGTKIVLGLGNVLVAILGFFIPVATRSGYGLNALILLRVIQGLVAGIVWPSMHDMTAKWIPPNERSRFVSSYLGSSVGAAITYPLCAFIIAVSDWEAVFYVTSAIGIVWYAFWVLLVYDAPQEHPRISDEEKNYILKSLKNAVAESGETKERQEVPWRAILTSGPFWVTIVSHWGGVWGFLTLITLAPTYFTYVQGWNINATGLLSGLPQVVRMIFSYLFSILADWLLSSKRMSLTGVRKFANLVCSGGMGVLILGLSFSGCEPSLAAFFVVAGTAVNGAVSSATIPAFVELSPNYASVLYGLCNLITVPAGFITTWVAGALTNDNQTIGQWRLVFLISVANLGFSAIVHMIWGTAEEQPWNNYEGKKSAKDVEEAHEIQGLVATKDKEKQEEEMSNEKLETEKIAVGEGEK